VIIFERAARREYAGLQRQDARRPRRLSYELCVDVPGYDEERHVRIEFPAAPDAWPRVIVDGHEDSPHRYSDGSLCLFYPGDAPEQRWVLADGLAALIDTIRVHLFQEEDARCGHGWSGEQAPHAAPQPHPRQPRTTRRRK
jgi:hypothetical protein